jgi:phage terminase large subunit-like protein
MSFPEFEEVLQGTKLKLGNDLTLWDTAQLKKLAETKLELERIKRNNPLLFYKPYESRLIKGRKPQEEFHKSKCKIRVVSGGNRCLGGECEIWDPELQVYRRVEDIRNSFHVLAWDGTKLVTAVANQPFTKEEDDLYEVGLSNGESFTCSLNHAVMTVHGEFATLFDVLFLEGGVLRESILESYQQVHVSNVQHSLKRVEDSKKNCSVCYHPYDERLHEGIDNVLDVVPLQGDAEERTSFLASVRRGDLENKEGCIHFYQQFYHPSSQDDQLHHEALYADILYGASYKLCKSTLDSRQFVFQSNHESCPRQSTDESVQRDKRCVLSCKSPFNELVVISIAYKRKDIKWDFEVPKYHNYYLGGAIHHNSGKSECGIVEDIYWATGLNPYRSIKPPTFGWIVSLDFPTSRDVAEDKVRRWLPASLIKEWDKQERVIYLTNGSTIGFRSCDQDINKFGGKALHWVHFDEEPSGERGYQIYKECLMRTADYQGSLWLTMTPVNGISWSYEELIEASIYDKDIFVTEIDSRENPHVPLRELEKIGEKLTQDEYDMRIKGKYVEFSGLVYKEFDRHKHIIPAFSIPADAKKYRTIDHGLNAPTACLWLFVNDRNEYYVYDEYYEENKTISENCSAIRQITAGDKIEWTTIDPATDARSPEDKVTYREKYRNAGILTRAPRSDKNLGIATIRELLIDSKSTGRPRLFIFNHCVNLIKEFSRYRYKKYNGSEMGHKVDEVVKVHDHALDALRYLIMSKPRYEMEEEDYSTQNNSVWYK